jgi:hypothetical protein
MRFPRFRDDGNRLAKKRSVMSASRLSFGKPKLLRHLTNKKNGANPTILSLQRQRCKNLQRN